ncbi:double-strand-break repair protein rad21-like protein 1 [Dipodomys spectabilis]|uniref:double-strand-break repair protein rad21-like protein 1 n=1 Tax=Dipodomys spectabilis TaxID=105255 RepID=UPI001C5380C5|nr:double-strand-break repair protein rad21-like protein 1 [Dipodomys spectabilis]
MFYAHALLSKRVPLAKVWLAAHWEKKLTKDQVFKCNIQKTIGKIISQKVKFALRTSGHLLLGVVRIYKRMVKYLLEDCSEAIVKMNKTFSPEFLSLPKGELEASYTAITFEEEFYDFDTDNINTIDASEHFTPNQSRPEEITLKEDYGKVLPLEAQNFGEGSQIRRGQSFVEGNTLLSCSVPLSEHSTGNLTGEKSLMCNNRDGFGDEGASETMTAKPDYSDGACFNSDDICFPEIEKKDATTLTTKQERFILHPIGISGTSEKRKRKKRRLLIDPVKELSNQSMFEQLISIEDTLKPIEFAPPTRKLMLLKERDQASTLLSTPSQYLVSDKLKKEFGSEDFGIPQSFHPQGVDPGGLLTESAAGGALDHRACAVAAMMELVGYQSEGLGVGSYPCDGRTKSPGTLKSARNLEACDYSTKESLS